MNRFEAFTGLVAPLDRANIDTDAIIPKQFLKSIKRTGFGVNLFDEWRYLDQGEPGMDNSQRPLNPDFILNQAVYKGASILLTRENFGCGSSREHAPWALADYGFNVILAPSFADIFYNNCFKNAILPICLPKQTIDDLFEQLAEQQSNAEDFNIHVDLEQQSLSIVHSEINSETDSKTDSKTISFDVDESRRDSLLNGLDEIAVTLQDSAIIKDYEDNRRKSKPWLFDVIC